MTDSPSHDLAGGDVDRPTLADRAAAASATTTDAEEHLEAGAYARSVLTEQLEDARQNLASTIDMMQVYQEQADAEQLVVTKLETAIADLDAAAQRQVDLERTVVDGDPHR